MDQRELESKYKELKANIVESGVRIRRYSLDPRLRLPDRPDDKGLGRDLRERADAAWEQWLDTYTAFAKLPTTCTEAQLLEIEERWLKLDRQVDLMQRDL